MPFDSTNYVAVETDPVLRVLSEARALIERGWCQGARARDSAGHPVDSISLQAASWCVVGAVEAAAMEHPSGHMGARLALSEVCHPRMPHMVNDDYSTTKADVLGWLDLASEARRK